MGKEIKRIYAPSEKARQGNKIGELPLRRELFIISERMLFVGIYGLFSGGSV